MASAPTLDYAAAAMRATRTCHACGHVYNAETVQRDPGWEPTRSGWRCGACSRARSRDVRARARELIAQADPRWELALRTPRHGPFDMCLECEAPSPRARRCSHGAVCHEPSAGKSPRPC